MIDRQKFEEAIYSLLFPAGLIPISCKTCLGLMDSRISEIHSLARGEGTTASRQRRILDPTESAELSKKIVELRDSKYPPMHYSDIARELGNVLSADACQCRYHDFKIRAKALQEKAKIVVEAAAVQEIQEATPEPAEIPTIRIPLIVEKAEEVMPDTKQSQSSSIIDLTKTGKYGRYVVPISSEVDAEIHRLRSGGMPTTGISNALAKKGILISWQRVRSVLATTARLTAKAERTKTAENVAPAHPEEPTSQSPPGVEGTQGIAREASGPTRGTPEEKPPTPKSISRAELDAKIWEMYTKEKLTEEEISDRLYAEGLFYSEKSVHIRLISQGAAI